MNHISCELVSDKVETIYNLETNVPCNKQSTTYISDMIPTYIISKPNYGEVYNCHSVSDRFYMQVCLITLVI